MTQALKTEIIAETVRFELTMPFLTSLFSRQVLSTTQPRLRFSTHYSLSTNHSVYRTSCTVIVNVCTDSHWPL